MSCGQCINGLRPMWRPNPDPSLAGEFVDVPCSCNMGRLSPLADALMNVIVTERRKKQHP